MHFFKTELNLPQTNTFSPTRRGRIAPSAQSLAVFLDRRIILPPMGDGDGGGGGGDGRISSHPQPPIPSRRDNISRSGKPLTPTIQSCIW